jgi:hypothetical protein
VNWYGLNWTDIVINVIALAIVPGLLAAYGGHLAAEAIQDSKRSRRVKLCFWGLFVFGVVVTFGQQLRAAEADLDRDTKNTWAQTLATRQFQPPPAPVIVGPERGKPDLGLMFFIHEGALRFNIVNPTSEPAANPKYWLAIIDYTNQYAYPQKPEVMQPLPIPAQTLQDFATPKLGLGNFEVLSDAAKAHVKAGDRLFGAAFITCFDCRRPETYWVYWEVGGGGWFSPIKAGTNPKLPYYQMHNVPNEVLDATLNALVPPKERMPLRGRDSLPIPLAPH